MFCMSIETLFRIFIAGYHAAIGLIRICWITIPSLIKIMLHNLQLKFKFLSDLLILYFSTSLSFFGYKDQLWTSSYIFTFLNTASLSINFSSIILTYIIFLIILVGFPQRNGATISPSFLPIHICCQQVFAGIFIIVIIAVPCPRNMNFQFIYLPTCFSLSIL